MGGAQSAERDLPAPQPGCFFNHVPQPKADWYSNFPVKYFETIRDYDCDCRMIGQCPAGPPPHPPVQEFLRSAGLENAEQLPREPEKIYQSDWSDGRYDPHRRRSLANIGGPNDPLGSKPFLQAAVEAFYDLPAWKQEQLLKKWLGTDMLAGENPLNTTGRLNRHRGGNPSYVVVNLVNTTNSPNETDGKLKNTTPSFQNGTQKQELIDTNPSHKPEARQLVDPISSPNTTNRKKELINHMHSFKPNTTSNHTNNTTTNNIPNPKSRELIEFSQNPSFLLSTFLANPSFVPSTPSLYITLINRCTTIAMTKAKHELIASSILELPTDPKHTNMRDFFATLVQEPWQFRAPTKLPPGHDVINFRGNSVKATDEICESVIEQATSTIKDDHGKEIYLNDVVDILDALSAAVLESETKKVPLQPEVEKKIAPLVTGQFELDEEELKEYFGETWPVYAVAFGFFTLSVNAAPELVTL